MKRRVVVEVDLDTLVGNYRKIVRHVRPAKVLCVLKANAYGLGVAVYAQALVEAGCRDFGVAEPFEAMELKKLFKKLGVEASVQILSAVLPEEIPPMVRAGVVLPVVDIASAKLISDAAVSARRKVKIHFKIDTGMGRLGILAKDAVSTMAEVFGMPNIECEGIFSHCPVAYDVSDPFTSDQIAVFKDIICKAEAKGLRFKKVHIAASDAVNNFPESAKAPFNMVRTGINLHGSFDPNGLKSLNVKPVLSLKTRVVQVRTLPAGTTVGYGRTWKSSSPSKIATISAGYADGLPLALSNRGKVIIRGRFCPVVGRVSMDYATVDVTGVENVKVGDEVVCFGSSGALCITPDDWAALKGTHAYDIICSLGTRVAREIKKGKRIG